MSPPGTGRSSAATCSSCATMCLLAHGSSESGALAGPQPLVVTGVGVTPVDEACSSRRRACVLSAASSTRARELAWFDMNGMRTGTMGEAGDLWQVRLSPDDQYAAVTLAAPLLRTLDIAIVPAASGTQGRPLTLALAADSDPVWSPDGRRVVVQVASDGTAGSVHEARARRRTPRTRCCRRRRCHANGLAGFEHPGSTLPTIVRATTSSRSTKRATREHDREERFQRNRWPLVARRSVARVCVGRIRTPGHLRDHRATASRVRVSFGGGTRPRWSRDGRSLFFLRGSAIMRATLADSAPAASPRRLGARAPGIRDFDVAHGAMRCSRSCRSRLAVRAGVGDRGLAIAAARVESRTAEASRARRYAAWI